MGIVVYLLCLYLAYAGARTTACPRGWLAADGSCYLFGTSNLKFVEAEATLFGMQMGTENQNRWSLFKVASHHFCRQNGGHLVEVSSAHENNILKTFMKQLQPKEWWVGITDASVESEWRWPSNDQLANFTDWHSGEPGPNTRLDVEDCAFFATSGQFQWFDVDCTTTGIAPVCEIRGSSCEETEIIG